MCKRLWHLIPIIYISVRGRLNWISFVNFLLVLPLSRLSFAIIKAPLETSKCEKGFREKCLVEVQLIWEAWDFGWKCELGLDTLQEVFGMRIQYIVLTEGRGNSLLRKWFSAWNTFKNFVNLRGIPNIAKAILINSNKNLSSR